MASNEPRARTPPREPPDRRYFHEPAASLPASQEPPAGPCYLLVYREDEESFARANPFALRRAIITLCGGDVAQAKPLRSGALLVLTKDTNQTFRVLNTTRLMDRAVSVTVADKLNCTAGVIRCPLLDGLGNEELLQELSTQGVVQVQRLPSRDVDRRGMNPTVKLLFQGQLPQSIYCGYSLVTVSPWIPPPSQCEKCWAIGSHTTRRCRRRQPICGRCPNPHPTEQCPAETPQCLNCGEAHEAWVQECPTRLRARADHRLKQQEAREQHQRPRRPGGVTWPGVLTPRDFPPLPAPGFRRAHKTRPPPEVHAEDLSSQEPQTPRSRSRSRSPTQDVPLSRQSEAPSQGREQRRPSPRASPAVQDAPSPRPSRNGSPIRETPASTPNPSPRGKTSPGPSEADTDTLEALESPTSSEVPTESSCSPGESKQDRTPRTRGQKNKKKKKGKRN